jgi:hypothetical protein
MFIGHYAVALAAKKAAPNTSLGTLVISVQLVDLLWPIMMLLGLEHVRIDPGNTVVTPLNFYDYPITHSLIGAVGWSVGFGLLYYAIRRYKRGALVLGLGVFSHWILDLITHRPDLPLGIGGNVLFGLGLWNSFWGTVVVELGILVIGLVLYLQSTSAKDRIGMYGFWGLTILFVLLYFANLLGPPPPSVEVIAYAGLGSWLFVLWAYWIDRHRTGTEVPATKTTTSTK